MSKTMILANAMIVPIISWHITWYLVNKYSWISWELENGWWAVVLPYTVFNHLTVSGAIQLAVVVLGLVFDLCQLLSKTIKGTVEMVPESADVWEELYSYPIGPAPAPCWWYNAPIFGPVMPCFRSAKWVRPESYVDKSPYVYMQCPAWQASIWRITSNSKRLVGHANKISGHIVTAWHVLQEIPNDELFLVIIRPGRKDVIVPITSFVFEQLLDDLVAAPILSGKGYTLTGLKDAPIKHVDGVQPACIATDYDDAVASVANVRNHTEAWGMVVYDGSTRGGFSGASYFHGNACYGIHTHGGVQNVGYAASYVAMRLKHRESSDYLALANMLQYSRDRRFQARRVAPDEMEVQFAGRYFRIDADEYGEIEDQYGEDVNWRRRPRERRDRYGESNPEALLRTMPEFNPASVAEFNPAALGNERKCSECALLRNELELLKDVQTEWRRWVEKELHELWVAKMLTEKRFVVLQQALDSDTDSVSSWPEGGGGR